MKILLTALIFFSLTVNSLTQDLPHYMTEQEKEIYKSYQPPVFSDFTDPPPTPVRTMAEWEELQGIIITWTSYTTILRQIVDYAQDEALVYIVCTDSNSVRSFLTSGGVPLVNLRFLLTSFNSVWCRDYGPWSVYSGVSDSLKMIDWIYNRPRPLDDQIPVFFSNYMNLPIYQTTQPPYDFVATGGNFMVDGHGTGFSSKLIVNENPGHTEAQINNIANLYMGLSRYIKMETLPFDGIHHIDMHMKLLDEETILVGQYPPGVSDGPQIEANLQYILNNFQTCFGRPFKVVRIPMPPSATGQYPPSSSYYTYTNSTFINKTVLVPIYGFPLDTTALRIYRDNLPGYKIFGINCSSMISASGAIHCINKEVGVSEPIFISHAKLLNTFNKISPHQVKAYIKSKTGISSAKVYWSTDTSQGFNPLTMTPSVGDTFRTSIPAQPVGTKVYYYVSASSNSGRTVTKPLTAPRGNFQFRIESPTAINDNGSQIKSFEISQNYPNPFNPSTKIKFEISLNEGKTSIVKLLVYDIVGREVMKLVDKALTAGSYEVQFDGGNFSSGIYFYKLIADGVTIDTKRMLLLK